MEDLDREVLALVAEHFLDFLLDDLARPVMGVDHVVADLVLDLRDLDLYLEVGGLLLDSRLADDVPPSCRWRGAAPSFTHVCRYRSTRLISCRRRRPSRMSFARMSPTPSTASSSASVAARISSNPVNSRTIAWITSFGRRGMRPRIR